MVLVNQTSELKLLHLTPPTVLEWLVIGKRQKMAKMKGLGDYMMNRILTKLGKKYKFTQSCKIYT